MRAQETKKGVSTRKQKSKLFKCTAAKCGNASFLDEVCDDVVDPEKKPLMRQGRHGIWCKQLSLFANNDDEVIATLAKRDDTKSGAYKQTKLKRGRGRKKIKREIGC